MVFCDFYPATTDGGRNDFESLREAIEKLSLNDSSFTFEMQHSEALGFGFRCGFLGMLHMDIVQERLEREENRDRPDRPHRDVQSRPQGWQPTGDPQPGRPPRRQRGGSHQEPIVKLEIICPNESIGDLIKLCDSRRGIFRDQKILSEERSILTTKCRWPKSSSISTTS